MMYFAGDPHSHFRQIEAVAARDRSGTFILLGDYDLPDSLERLIPVSRDRTWWIHGNHDGDRIEWHDRLFGSALADRCLDRRVVEIDGVRIAGLGGVFRGEIWHPETGVRFRRRQDYLAAIPTQKIWRGGLPIKHRASIWWEDYEYLWSRQADILVTHEAPSSHPHGFQALDDLAEAMGVKMIVHGHHHETYSATLRGAIQVLGVGLAQVVNQAGELMAEAGRPQRSSFADSRHSL